MTLYNAQCKHVCVHERVCGSCYDGHDECFNVM